MSTTTLTRRGSIVDQFIPATLITNVLLVVVGAAFVGALAQISWTVPGLPAPFTGQTLGVLVVGGTLGARRAVSAMALYAVAGLAGMPWFAAQTHGWNAGTKPLFGYIIGFMVAGVVMGYLSNKGTDRTVSGAIGMFVLGELAIYAVGVTWLSLDLHHTLSWGITYGMVPYLVWDIAKAVVAGSLLPLAWRLLPDQNS